MHELGTIKYVIDMVEDLCVKNNLKEVRSVTLEIGEVSGIIKEYLIDFWQWAVPKTTYLKSSKLLVETIKAVTYCENCGQTYETIKYAKVCPYCNSNKTFLLKGNEYIVKEIEAT